MNENPLLDATIGFLRDASLPVQLAAGFGAGSFATLYIIGWVNERIEDDGFVQKVGATHDDVKELHAEIKRLNATIQSINERLSQ